MSGILQMDQVQVMKVKYFLFFFVILLWIYMGIEQHSFGSVLLPDLPQLNVSCSPHLVTLGALMGVIITVECAEQSLTPGPHLAPLVLLPGEQLQDRREPFDTHTFLIQLLLILTHTILPLPEEWVKENALSVCLPAERSIIYMDGDRQGGVFSLALSSTVWTLSFCYCTSVCPLWSVLHFAFFITNLGQ